MGTRECCSTDLPRRARRRKEATYPELVGRRARARLVVLGVEVGGRVSEETRSFVTQLAGCPGVAP